MTRAEALARHHEIAIELGHKHREFATVLSSERKAKIDAFMQTQGTDKVRDMAASHNAYAFTQQQWQLKGEIAALEEERDDIRWQLANGGVE